jgi:CheY-like chemotaxis protein
MSNVPAVLRGNGHAKKRILLIDSFATKRDLRAKVLRKMGIEVDCAADISEARSLWQADSYNLVLLDVKRDPRNVEEFCTEMQSAKPPQMLAFLVGKPEYLGATPCADTGVPLVDGTRNGMWSEMVASLFTSACEFLPRRYGFLEASWRIAATRSIKDPRSKPAALDAILPAGKRKHWSWTDAVQRHSPPATVEPGVGPDSEPDTTANIANDKETL